jgi:hypothetical protein
MTSAMPRPFDLGALHDFRFDVATQTLTVVVGVMPSRDSDWYLLTARFGRIIVFDFECDIPVVLSPETGCDEFRELASSDLLGSVTEKGQWTLLSRQDRTRLIPGEVTPAEFRHFPLYGSALWAEWLCADAEFLFDEQPLPPAPPPIKADRNPFG